MPFQKAVLGECPECKQLAVEVIESRKSGLARRRRKECKACQHRFTTYEVPQHLYEAALEAMALEQMLRDRLGANAPAEPKPCVCTECLHVQYDRCAFGLPEYDTPEAQDCIYLKRR